MSKDLYDVLHALYEAGKDNMTPAALANVGDVLTEEAAALARNMSTVTEGIACLVSADVNRAAGCLGAGSFQHASDVFILLCAISKQFDYIAAMVDVGTEAKWKAQQITAAASSVPGGPAR